MKKILFALLLTCLAGIGYAQRVTDKLNRGLVAVPQGDKTGQDSRYGISGTGIFVSWRILPTEYYDTKYNLYRGSTKIASNLTVSNYQDDAGTKTSVYKVVPVVNGTERTDLAAQCTPWDHQYWEIPVKSVTNRNGAVVTGYTLNDCSVADVDGDGQMEFVVKRRNDSGNLRSGSNNTDFNLHECYKMDGTRLWWIDMGPNLMSGPDEQFDLILYDWDQDGKAEAIMRGADNMIIHTATNKTIKIGNMSTGLNVDRPEYMGVGNEYLLYLNGETGEPYGWDGSESWTPMAYPLPQFESNETKGDANVWGDLGHRMQKHYFGAPYLDGRNPSIFLGRGAYTRHKFCALSVNKETHELTQLWRWNCYDGGSPWFGNGFHNYAIADVDMDGRDEIVFGSMMIDDTGFGLSTTGYGHGDAQHCGDLDPYRWGLEQFVCLEGATVPGIAYTNATTSEQRYTTGGGSDNGRCMAGNFYNSYPGAIGISGGAISLVSDKAITSLGSYGDDYVNMRVYWDGDLLDEFMDSPGVEKSPCVYKAPGQTEVGTGRSYPNDRCWMGQGNLNNSSKNNPCFLGDILGDWREEIVTRNGDKLIIQISSYPSTHGITTLWADHEYRNAMAWQCMGYNQPPHTSFFLGEMEGITKEPPANTLEGRTEVENGGTIGTTDAHLLISGYENKTVSVTDGAEPYILTVNAPAWLKGSGSKQATSSTPKLPTQTVETFTTTLTGGAFSGSTRIIKQGEGVLVLPKVTEKHSGETNVWQGTLVFDGTMESSPVWLNRHTTLISDGGTFNGGLKADYNATIYPGGKDNVGNITASALTLGFGSRIVFDGSEGLFDKVNATSLSIEAKTEKVWNEFGPRYKAPVIQIKYDGALEAGTYELGTIGSVTGNVSDLLIEGTSSAVKTSLNYEEGKLLLVVENMRPAGEVTWNGTSGNNTWQQAVSENFLYEGETSVMANGDDVIFDDDAASTTVVIKGAVHPNSVTFNNETKSYTLSGDSIVGKTLTINGAGGVTFNNWNRVSSTVINAGKVTVSMLANSNGQDWGSLGKTSSAISLNDGATLVTNGVIITDQSLKISGEVSLEVPSGKSVIFNKAIKGSGAVLNKLGAGSMELGTAANTFAKLVIKNGIVTSNYSSSNAETLPGTVEFYNGTLWGANMEGGSGVSNTTNFIVPANRSGSFYSSFRGTYTGKLTGAGTFNVYTGGVRAYFNGDWSAFEGTIVIGKNNRQNKKQYDPEFLLGNSKGMPLATVNVNENARLQNQGNNINVKKFGGTGALVGTGQWIVNSDENFTLTTEVGITYERKDDYGNTIPVSASPLTKNGTGKMTITPGKLNGMLTINDGIVTFNDKNLSTLVNGKYQTYVKNSGRLVGQGYFNGLTIQNGGEIKPCGSTVLETTQGTIKCANTININEGATATFLIRTAAQNSAFETKNLTFNGTLKIELGSSLTPEAGQQWTLWTVSNTLQGTIAKYELPELPDGLYWDISGLQEKTGVISVTDDATVGFRLTTVDPDPCNIYDLQGRFVLRTSTPNSINGLPSGIYIRAGKKFRVK